MYIKSIEMTNIRSIRELNIVFPNPAGWHVLLGDNGAGKSSIIRAISAALIGPTEILRLDPDFSTWVTTGQESAKIELQIERDLTFDKRSGKGGAKAGVIDRADIRCVTTIKQEIGNGRTWKFKDDSPKIGGMHPDYYNWGTGDGWFSAAFGPYRRFTGGDHAMEMHYVRNPVLGAHLTAFKENVALTESVVWLKDLQFRNLTKASSIEGRILDGIIHFTNQNDLLPEGFRLAEITPDGPMFSLPNGSVVHLNELSEGIKSVTSLAFELMRLLLQVYNPETLFGNFLDQDPDNDFVPVPGVVLIDEIDVHLHPIWQARIGKWFTQCFPNMQFIVTTHSPLVCRAAVNGSIWRLPDPGSNDSVEQILGQDLQSLLYGDILDAFSTGIFGETTDRDDSGKQKLQRLAELNVKFYRDEASKDELLEREKLLSLFPTYDAHFA
jgi:hypothetical protein